MGIFHALRHLRQVNCVVLEETFVPPLEESVAVLNSLGIHGVRFSFFPHRVLIIDDFVFCSDLSSKINFAVFFLVKLICSQQILLSSLASSRQKGSNRHCFLQTRVCQGKGCTAPD